MKPRTLWPLAVPGIGAALVLAAYLYRSKPAELPPAAVIPRDVPPANPPPPVMNPPPALPGGRPTSPEPLLRKWQTAVAQRDAPGVLAAQAALLEREGEYREPLVQMAKEDRDPRIRAFTVAVLGRMKSPPPEQFFIDRLTDASTYPQTSALEALRKIGTSACLPMVDGLAEAHSQESVRAAAAETAKAVRSR